jgi:hypothetical protein
MKGRQFCMDEETERIFIATLEDAKKYHRHVPLLRLELDRGRQ